MRTAEINIEAVKTLCKAVGVREGARQMGLSEERVMKWSQRDPVGPWGPAAKPSPQNVRTAPQALANAVETLGTRTRLSLAKGTAHMASKSEKAGLDQAGNVHKVAQTAAIVHGWDSDKREGDRIMINIGLLNQ